jgi:choice-of-anchor B domain-containing protein
MTVFRHRRLSKAARPLAASLLVVLLGIGSFLFAHDEESLPHQGNPPLHAQDTMRAFQSDHHEPENLAAMSITSCVDGFAGTYPCSNIDLMAFLPLNQIGGGSGNDIWGWTDPLTGDEYALMGRTNGTSFVNITDPLNPVYLGNLPPPASNSSWRDIKVYANHAFIVSEANQSGIQVFDLTQLRNVPSPPVTFSQTAGYDGILTAHNLVINEASGYAYAVGTNTCSGGLHMVNIQNPTNPTFAGCFSADGYTHDAQCVTYQGPDTVHQGKEICFNSNEDTLTIVDVTNKSAPLQLSRTGYTGRRYTHQGWLTEDHAHFLLDDELDERDDPQITNTRTYVWDVSNLDNPINIGFHDSTAAAIDHNQYIKGSYVYQANYRAGLRILDISDISNANLSEVGYFDIYPSSDSTGFNGAWSNYPYFDSGLVVVSGI